MFGARRHPLDPAAERHAARLVSGDESAWHDFVLAIAPFVEATARTSRHLGPLRDSADERRAILTELLARLRRTDHRALRAYPPWVAASPGKTFEDWFTIVVTNCIRSHVRGKLGGRAAPEADRAERINKRMVNSLAGALASDDRKLGFRPAVTDDTTARELCAFAAEELPAEQWEALRRWLAGATFAEIAEACALPAASDAERATRAALARLRRHVARG